MVKNMCSSSGSHIIGVPCPKQGVSYTKLVVTLKLDYYYYYYYKLKIKFIVLTLQQITIYPNITIYGFNQFNKSLLSLYIHLSYCKCIQIYVFKLNNEMLI
jgi:hypothetical protein